MTARGAAPAPGEDTAASPSPDSSPSEAQLQRPGAALAAEAQLARRRSRELGDRAGSAIRRASELLSAQPSARTSIERCFLLREDPELAAHVAGDMLSAATSNCVAAAITLPKGPWQPEGDDARSGIGLLVLDGLLLRRVGIGGRFGAELLGAGDLVRPWQHQEEQTTVPVTTEWRILQPARLAVLDGRASDRLARFPGLTTALTAKVIARARATAMMTAIVQQPRVALRVELLFWLLADRWGRVRSDGILLRLPLSHAVISELVAARRPSVTVALGNLIDRGLLVRHPDGFLLRGEPPQLTV